MIKASQFPNAFKPILLMLVVSTVGHYHSAQERSASTGKQRAAELAADRMLKRFYETLQFETVWNEFYVSNEAFRRLEVEAITFSLVKYRADRLPYNRISTDARERAYIARYNFLATLSAALFTSGNIPKDDGYGRLYESITVRPKPYVNSVEMDRDFTAVMEQLSNANRKFVVRENVGSQSYREKVDRFEESKPANVERIREVFAPAGLGQDVQIYVVKREMFHIYMIEEGGDFKVLSILTRTRG